MWDFGFKGKNDAGVVSFFALAVTNKLNYIKSYGSRKSQTFDIFDRFLNL